MALKQLGKPLKPRSEPITSGPGIGWTLSKTAQEKIDKIEANARTAEQRVGSMVLRGRK